MDNGSKKSLPLHSAIDFDNRIAIEGITAIITSDDKMFCAKASDNILTVKGENLSIELVDLSCNKVILNGKITCVQKSGQLDPKGFFKRLFK